MSEASIEHCEECRRPVYDCDCRCEDCGELAEECACEASPQRTPLSPITATHALNRTG
jgi:hypothetical protein